MGVKKRKSKGAGQDEVQTGSASLEGADLSSFSSQALLMHQQIVIRHLWFRIQWWARQTKFSAFVLIGFAWWRQKIHR